jgi:hypothetical protein
LEEYSSNAARISNQLMVFWNYLLIPVKMNPPTVFFFSCSICLWYGLFYANIQHVQRNETLSAPAIFACKLACIVYVLVDFFLGINYTLVPRQRAAISRQRDRQCRNIADVLKPTRVRVLYSRQDRKYNTQTPIGFNASAMLRHWRSRPVL